MRINVGRRYRENLAAMRYALDKNKGNNAMEDALKRVEEAAKSIRPRRIGVAPKPPAPVADVPPPPVPTAPVPADVRIIPGRPKPVPKPTPKPVEAKAIAGDLFAGAPVPAPIVVTRPGPRWTAPVLLGYVRMHADPRRMPVAVHVGSAWEWPRREPLPPRVLPPEVVAALPF